MTFLAGFLDFFSSDATWETLSWILIIALMVSGFVGTFLPIIPGTTLILVAILIHYFGLGMEESRLTWKALVIIGILYIASIIIDWISGAIGAKFFGSSKWGVIGAILGGIIGIFFSLPGLIIGPIAGVFIFEMAFGKKEVKEASNSTLGTVLGGLAGIVARVCIAIGMIAVYVLDVFVVN